MSDQIGHECGVAFLRLLKPLKFYQETFGDLSWGLRKACLLMQKQRNRGQDGAGLAVTKFDMPPGIPFLPRVRSNKTNAVERVFEAVTKTLPPLNTSLNSKQIQKIKLQAEFLGEGYLGHLRYATHHDHNLTNCHPRIRKHNVLSRNLALAGNFNMTNANDLFKQLIKYGLNPVGESDTQVILENLSHAIDEEHRLLRMQLGSGSFQNLQGKELASNLSKELNLIRALKKGAEDWDGAFFFAGFLGNGDGFLCRDAAGIRPGFILQTENFIAAASERAALANVFDASPNDVDEIQPGTAIVIKKNGIITKGNILPPVPKKSCTFERIYFSRGSDPAIYNERKMLGKALATRLLKNNTDSSIVLTFIPNTAETAFIGLTEEFTKALACKKIPKGFKSERLLHKDQKLRTFITRDSDRDALVSHIYDTCRGIVTEEDTLVVLDDSIVRGTTLRTSIIHTLAQLKPKKIIIASSAPPICYPDCYGIDMSQLGRFIAFQAALKLLEEDKEYSLLDNIEYLCIKQESENPKVWKNHVKLLYERVNLERLSHMVAKLITPEDLNYNGSIEVVYQNLDGLKSAMPDHNGDWYFTGDYPTKGGYRILNKSFLQWKRGHGDKRAYEAIQEEFVSTQASFIQNI